MLNIKKGKNVCPNWIFFDKVALNKKSFNSETIITITISNFKKSKSDGLFLQITQKLNIKKGRSKEAQRKEENTFR